MTGPNKPKVKILGRKPVPITLLVLPGLDLADRVLIAYSMWGADADGWCSLTTRSLAQLLALDATDDTLRALQQARARLVKKGMLEANRDGARGALRPGTRPRMAWRCRLPAASPQWLDTFNRLSGSGPIHGRGKRGQYIQFVDPVTRRAARTQFEPEQIPDIWVSGVGRVEEWLDLPGWSALLDFDDHDVRELWAQQWEPLVARVKENRAIELDIEKALDQRLMGPEHVPVVVGQAILCAVASFALADGSTARKPRTLATRALNFFGAKVGIPGEKVTEHVPAFDTMIKQIIAAGKADSDAVTLRYCYDVWRDEQNTPSDETGDDEALDWDTMIGKATDAITRKEDDDELDPLDRAEREAGAR